MTAPLTPASQQPMLALLAVLLLTSGTLETPVLPDGRQHRWPHGLLSAATVAPLEQAA